MKNSIHESAESLRKTANRLAKMVKSNKLIDRIRDLEEKLTSTKWHLDQKISGEKSSDREIETLKKLLHDKDPLANQILRRICEEFGLVIHDGSPIAADILIADLRRLMKPTGRRAA